MRKEEDGGSSSRTSSGPLKDYPVSKFLLKQVSILVSDFEHKLTKINGGWWGYWWGFLKMAIRKIYVD
jgi:hypothetical protein